MSAALRNAWLDAGDPIRAERNARLLFRFAVAAVIAACTYYGVTAKTADPLHLYEGLLMLVLAAIPAIRWARNGGQQLPIFEVFMLTTANTYALPLLNGHESLRMYPPELISSAGFTVLLFQVVCILTFYGVRGRPGRTPFYTDEVLGGDLTRFVGLGLTITTIYTFVSIYTDLIPQELASIFRAVFYGIGLVSIFVLSRQTGIGLLKPQERAWFIFNMVSQVTMMFSTLFLVGGVSWLVLALLGYVSGSRRIPFVTLGICVAVLAILHNGKSSMRAEYWRADGFRKQAEFVELPSFFTKWVEYGVTTVPGNDPDEEQQLAAKLLDRTSLFHLLCLVQAQTPDWKPFLNGETYWGIPAQFVPRILWPDKPLAHAATSTMSVYYGLQRIEDTATTTIGFGMLIESYVNFGMFGVAGFAAFFGFFYKQVHARCADSPMLSFAGLFTVVLMAWSFQTEAPLGMWLSSMFQACVAVMAVPFLLRNLFGR
ncbi:MAG: hypothetical protein NVV63_16485 [Opitutus sp.]|nr:hypothetical protein [Opitutus sp.]